MGKPTINLNPEQDRVAIMILMGVHRIRPIGRSDICGVKHVMFNADDVDAAQILWDYEEAARAARAQYKYPSDGQVLECYLGQRVQALAAFRQNIDPDDFIGLFKNAELKADTPEETSNGTD